MGSNKITESTLIPISFLVILAGGVFWLSAMYAQGQSNAREIAEIKTKQDRYTETVQAIDSRLSRIEGAVGIAKEK